MSSEEPLMGRIADRRKRQRVIVQWPVRIWRRNEHVLDACTVNISSGGLYCICPGPLSPGDTLIAILEIPGSSADRERPKLMLRCEILVLRVETLADNSQFGVACRIMNYSVLRPTGAAVGTEEADTGNWSLFHAAVDGTPAHAGTLRKNLRLFSNIQR